MCLMWHKRALEGISYYTEVLSSEVEESYVQWSVVNCSAIDISALWFSDVVLKTTSA